MFEPVTFIWMGAEYDVPPERVMGLIAVIEEHITHEQLIYVISSVGETARLSMQGAGFEALAKSKIPRVVISRAMSSALRYAGAKATDEDVFKTLFGAEGITTVLIILDNLLKVTAPPEEMQQEPEKKPKAQPKKRTAASSKRRTK